MSTRYWESENPEEAQAGNKTLLRWYHKAGKLQVHRTFVAQDGTTKTAAVVTIDLKALGESREALDLMRRAMEAAVPNDRVGASQRQARRRRPNGALSLVN